MDENQSEQHNRRFDFDDVYANNSSFEISVWDLKIIFGQLDQSSGSAEVDWHTAVTMPWAAAKIACYYLRANIAIQEARIGPIRIPQEVLPPPPNSPSGDTKDNPTAIAVYEQLKKMHDELVEDNG